MSLNKIKTIMKLQNSAGSITPFVLEGNKNTFLILIIFAYIGKKKINAKWLSFGGVAEGAAVDVLSK